MRLAPATALAALICLPGVALAQAAAQPGAAEMRAAGYLAANCANCHGTAGRNAGSLPSLAGMSASGLAKGMRDFRDGKRKATIMHQLAKGYTDEQIDAMAMYFAAQSAK
jgi:sulfide dehydrogenase cytochrome subunit